MMWISKLRKDVRGFLRDEIMAEAVVLYAKAFTRSR